MVCLALAACSGSTTSSDPITGSPPDVVDDTPIGNDDEDDDQVDDDTEEPVPPGTARLTVLSNRPDLISAGDVLVEVAVGEDRDLPNVVLSRNGQDVTGVLEAKADDPLTLLGVVDGLALGDNVISLTVEGVDNGSAAITNHPTTSRYLTQDSFQPVHIRIETVLWVVDEEGEGRNLAVESPWKMKPSNSIDSNWVWTS